jgi:hypothetical protein
MFEWYKMSTVCYAYLSDVPPENASSPPEEASSPHNLTDEELKIRVWSLECRLTDEALATCRWFTRGWTLQELIAPKDLIFFDQSWSPRGTKMGLAGVLSKRTGIDESVLKNYREMARQSVAVKMSWTSKRDTTRLEDTAYCLLGIFNVNMPLLYGE